MPLQVRLADGSLVSPDRDIRLMYQDAVIAVKAHFEATQWPELVAFAEDAGAEWGDLEEALDCYIQFLNFSTRDSEETMHDCLVKSGFLAVKPAAQIALMAMLGRVVTGQFFHAIRSTTALGETMAGLPQIVRQGLLDLRTGEPKRKQQAKKSWLRSMLGLIRASLGP